MIGCATVCSVLLGDWFWSLGNNSDSLFYCTTLYFQDDSFWSSFDHCDWLFYIIHCTLLSGWLLLESWQPRGLARSTVPYFRALASLWLAVRTTVLYHSLRMIAFGALATTVIGCVLIMTRIFLDIDDPTSCYNNHTGTTLKRHSHHIIINHKLYVRIGLGEDVWTLDFQHLFHATLGIPKCFSHQLLFYLYLFAPASSIKGCSRCKKMTASVAISSCQHSSPSNAIEMWEVQH